MSKFVYMIRRKLKQIIKISRSWQHVHFGVVSQKRIYFSSKGKENVNDPVAKNKRRLGAFSASIKNGFSICEPPVSHSATELNG